MTAISHAMVQSLPGTFVPGRIYYVKAPADSEFEEWVAVSTTTAYKHQEGSGGSSAVGEFFLVPTVANAQTTGGLGGSFVDVARLTIPGANISGGHYLIEASGLVHADLVTQSYIFQLYDYEAGAQANNKLVRVEPKDNASTERIPWHIRHILSDVPAGTDIDIAVRQTGSNASIVVNSYGTDLTMRQVITL